MCRILSLLLFISLVYGVEENACAKVPAFNLDRPKPYTDKDKSEAQGLIDSLYMQQIACNSAAIIFRIKEKAIRNRIAEMRADRKPLANYKELIKKLEDEAAYCARLGKEAATNHPKQLKLLEGLLDMAGVPHDEVGPFMYLPGHDHGDMTKLRNEKLRPVGNDRPIKIDKDKSEAQQRADLLKDAAEDERLYCKLNEDKLTYDCRSGYAYYGREIPKDVLKERMEKVQAMEARMNYLAIQMQDKRKLAYEMIIKENKIKDK